MGLAQCSDNVRQNWKQHHQTTDAHFVFAAQALCFCCTSTEFAAQALCFCCAGAAAQVLCISAAQALQNCLRLQGSTSLGGDLCPMDFQGFPSWLPRQHAVVLPDSTWCTLFSMGKLCVIGGLCVSLCVLRIKHLAYADRPEGQQIDFRSRLLANCRCTWEENTTGRAFEALNLGV